MTVPSARDTAQPEPPRVLRGRYELAGVLGADGTSNVHLARDIELDRTVAVKLLPRDPEPEQVERLRREARAVAAIEHPNVVAVHDLAICEEVAFAVMEHVRGEALREVLARENRLAPGRAARIAGQVCCALSAAHHAGVVHRDISTGNIMLCPDGTVKVLDFGIARLTSSAFRTVTGLVCGTPAFLSPEQARGQTPDARSDPYSLGCCLYQMVTGRGPFGATDPLAVVSGHLHEPPRAPREIDPTVPYGLERIIMRALGKRPSDRYQTADQMHAALAEQATARTLTLSAQAGAPSMPGPSAAAVAPEPGDTTEADTGGTRRWVGLTLIAVACAVLLVLGLIAGAQTLW